MGQGIDGAAAISGPTPIQEGEEDDEDCKDDEDLVWEVLAALGRKH